MKPSKKILILGFSLSAISAISFAFAWGLSVLFGINFWAIFCLVTAIQISGGWLYEKFYQEVALFKALKEYTAKPYKKYEIPLNCQVCGKENIVEIDLTDTEFKCENCNRKNGIYVTFASAAITELSGEAS